MTNLEALECIIVDLTPKAKEHNKEEIEQVRKSLKVLEILKRMVIVRKGTTWYYLDTEHPFFESQEDIDKVKEWLKDE